MVPVQAAHALLRGRAFAANQPVCSRQRVLGNTYLICRAPSALGCRVGGTVDASSRAPAQCRQLPMIMTCTCKCAMSHTVKCTIAACCDIMQCMLTHAACLPNHQQLVSPRRAHDSANNCYRLTEACPQAHRQWPRHPARLLPDAVLKLHCPAANASTLRDIYFPLTSWRRYPAGSGSMQ